jgi:aquaporin related protein
MDSHTHYPEAGTGAYPNRPTTLTQRKSSRHLTPPRSPPNRTDFHDVGSPNTIRNAYPAPYYMQHHAGISAGSIEPKRGKGLRGHFVAATGEFVGTFMFLWFAFAGQLMVIEQASDTAVLNGKQSSQTIVFVSLIYGLSLLVNAWGWFRISGGLFNP